MTKTRIVKRKSFFGDVEYVIQQKHWLFFWLWVDAWQNHIGYAIKDSFSSLEEAKKNLCYFDGSKPFEEVIE